MGRLETGAAEVWRERLGRQARSGLSIAEFCRREGVSAASFYQWRRRLKGSGGGKRQPAFQQVVVRPASSLSALRVRLAGGAEIEVGGEDLEVIRAVVGELARADRESAGQEGPSC